MVFPSGATSSETQVASSVVKATLRAPLRGSFVAVSGPAEARVLSWATAPFAVTAPTTSDTVAASARALIIPWAPSGWASWRWVVPLLLYSSVRDGATGEGHRRVGF